MIFGSVKDFAIKSLSFEVFKAAAATTLALELPLLQGLSAHKDNLIYN